MTLNELKAKVLPMWAKAMAMSVPVPLAVIAVLVALVLGRCSA